MSPPSGLAGATILLTGATGFLGSHCLRRLSREKCEVHAVSRTRHEPAASGVRWHAADLRDAAQATSLVASVKPSHLLHSAWIAVPGVYAASPENLAWLEAGVALLRAFGEHGGRRFLGVGSSAEYEASELPCKEDATPIRPTSVYGACKAALWLAAEAAARHYGFSATWGRVFLLYGEGDMPQRLLPSVMAGLASGRVVDTTDGHQVRDFVHAADAADLLVRLLASDEPGAFNIGTGRATEVRYAIEYVADRLRAKSLLRMGAIERPASEPPFLVADPEKVRSRLGAGISTTLEARLEALLATPGFGVSSRGRRGTEQRRER